MNRFILFLLTLIKLSASAGVPVVWTASNYCRTGRIFIYHRHFFFLSSIDRFHCIKWYCDL